MRRFVFDRWLVLTLIANPSVRQRAASAALSKSHLTSPHISLLEDERPPHRLKLSQEPLQCRKYFSSKTTK